jgi:dihydroorotate dehydrogenase (NAD+) catalytic subunit
MVELETKIFSLRMRTPLIPVSGIFSIDYLKLLPNLSGIGAVVTKSVTKNPREGNEEPRVIETPAGMLNSIGIQNPGIKKFLREHIPMLRLLEVPIIVSVAGSTIEEYVEVSSLLAKEDAVDAIELNVSCPNVEQGGMSFGCDPSTLKTLVTNVRNVVGDKILITKLTPNVTDIVLPAQAAIEGGSNVISLINTLTGMAIDLNTRKPKLGNKFGGLSGQAIHPVAVYLVHRCYTLCCKEKNIPIIGIGGVSSGEDALELILAGATCVGIGTAMFRDQYEIKRSNKMKSIFQSITDYLIGYMQVREIKNISDLVGKADIG